MNKKHGHCISQEKAKQIVDLFYTGKYTLDEISIKTGISEGTVSKYITKALKKKS